MVTATDAGIGGMSCADVRSFVSRTGRAASEDAFLEVFRQLPLAEV